MIDLHFLLTSRPTSLSIIVASYCLHNGARVSCHPLYLSISLSHALRSLVHSYNHSSMQIILRFITVRTALIDQMAELDGLEDAQRREYDMACTR